MPGICGKLAIILNKKESPPIERGLQRNFYTINLYKMTKVALQRYL